MVRAKMKVTAITTRSSSYATGNVQSSNEVELNPVSDPANKTWAKYTPGGSVKLTIDNPEAFGQFKAGDTFFVDFTPAPATEAEEKVI